MMRNNFILTGLLLFTLKAFNASAQSDVAPRPADEVVQFACKEAAASHRKVFMVFHASWCGWCHRMDSLMAAPACKKLFQSNYVITHLDIMERDDKKSLENPGALELYTKYAGEKGQGIPFWLIIDADGTVVADSRVKPDGIKPVSAGDNSGCPSEKQEVAYFLKVLQATSSLTGEQLHTVEEQFVIRRG